MQMRVECITLIIHSTLITPPNKPRNEMMTMKSAHKEDTNEVKNSGGLTIIHQGRAENNPPRTCAE